MITGKHREHLIELLLYHIGQPSKDDDTIQEYYASISASVKIIGSQYVNKHINKPSESNR